MIWRYICADQRKAFHCWHYHGKGVVYTVTTHRKNCDGPPDEENFTGYWQCCHCPVVRMSSYSMDGFKHFKEFPK